MITVRRAAERRHQRRLRQETWLTFHPRDEADEFERGFGPLEVLKEGRLPPRDTAQESIEGVEVITYVHEGTLLYEDSSGRSGVLRSGEFQRTMAETGTRRSESNASANEWAHVFQIWLRPPVSVLDASDGQRRFSRAERHGGLCMVASPDGREGSLLIHQDSFVYSGILDSGQHVVHELREGRSAWLHVVTGNVKLGDETLCAGDGAGFRLERAVSVTATDDSELLLVDLTVGGDADLSERGTVNAVQRDGATLPN